LHPVSWPVDPQLYIAYLGVMFVFVITPGPAILFAVATGVQQGAPGVALATAGMNLGNVVWYIAAALGLSALAATFPTAFEVLRWAGIAYLVWLGLRNLWAARHAEAPHGSAIRFTGRPFRDGLVVQLANPKALLFMTGVLPPFIAPDRPLWPQIALFAAASITFDVIAMMAYGLGGAAFAHRLTQPRARRAFAATAGVLFLLAAVLILIRH
jgi:threonine/homoserine/homoserine lactone efflux protein